MTKKFIIISLTLFLLSVELFNAQDETAHSSKKRIESLVNPVSCAECLVSGKLNEKVLKKDFKCFSCDIQKNLITQLGNYLFSDSLNAQQRFIIAHALQKLLEYKKKKTETLEELCVYEENLQLVSFIIAHLYPHPLYAALENANTDMVQILVKNYPTCLNTPITLPAREKSVCGTMLDHLKTILAKEQAQIQYLSPVSVRDEFEAKKYEEMKERVISLEKLLHTLHAAGAQSLQDFNKRNK